MNDKASKLKGLVWVLAALLFGAVFAFGVAPIAHAIPWSWEKKIGGLLDDDVPEQGCRYNPQAKKLLQQMVTRIYPLRSEDAAFSIDVRIVKSPIVNAYAGLGGKISIYSGLLKRAESPEEVACVIAHEIGHVEHRHIMQGTLTYIFTSQGMNIIFGQPGTAASLANFFLNMSFTRVQETQADESGLRRLQDAHVDNKGFKDFFERMENENSAPQFLSDHPSDEARLEMADTFTNKDVKPIMTKDEWKNLKNYCSEK